MDSVFGGFRCGADFLGSSDMTNANALPIQERLRDGERRFLKWAYKEQYSGPSVLSIPRHPDNVDALLAEAAERIDALEKALREIAGKRDIDEITRDEWYDIDFIRCGYDECIKIARDAVGERK